MSTLFAKIATALRSTADELDRAPKTAAAPPAEPTLDEIRAAYQTAHGRDLPASLQAKLATALVAPEAPDPLGWSEQSTTTKVATPASDPYAEFDRTVREAARGF